MLEIIRGWVLGLAAVSIISGIAISLTGSAKMKRVVSLVCSFLAASVLISPVSALEALDFDLSGTDFASRAEKAAASLDETNYELKADIIRRESEAYILDKAESYGASITVEVAVSTAENGEPLPYSCEIWTSSGETVKELLASVLEQELGIPRERQYWR